MEGIKILSPCGILGYGYPKESFYKGLEKKPDVIAVDAGSTDAGPHKLGAGVGIVSIKATKKDLEPMLRAGYELKIPVIIGSAGGSGAAPHIDWTMNIIRDIITEKKMSFKAAVISADVDKEYLRSKIRSKDVASLGPVPELTEETLDQTLNIVGQMGHEPIMTALKNGAELVVAGRAYDPSIFAAWPILKGFDGGLAYHLGKILECGALCAEPGTAKDCVMGHLRRDHFLVEPLNSKRKCTTIAGIRDPIMIKNIEEIRRDLIEQVTTYYDDIPTSEYRILFHLYGKNGVMGPLEPLKETAHELGIVMEVVASTQELADTICSMARSSLMHFPYRGRKATAGNLAFLYSPSDIVFGPVYKFTIYHLLNVNDPCELFKISYFDL